MTFSANSSSDTPVVGGVLFQLVEVSSGGRAWQGATGVPDLGVALHIGVTRFTGLVEI